MTRTGAPGRLDRPRGPFAPVSCRSARCVHGLGSWQPASRQRGLPAQAHPRPKGERRSHALGRRNGAAALSSAGSRPRRGSAPGIDIAGPGDAALAPRAVRGRARAGADGATATGRGPSRTACIRRARFAWHPFDPDPLARCDGQRPSIRRGSICSVPGLSPQPGRLGGHDGAASGRPQPPDRAALQREPRALSPPQDRVHHRAHGQAHRRAHGRSAGHWC